MRKVVLFIATSLDGYISRENGDVDWLFDDGEDYGYTEFFAKVDTVIMGRKTFDVAMSFGDTSFEKKDTYILTRSEEKDRGSYKFVNRDIPGLMKELQGKDGGDIWLVGGAEVIKEFVENNLIDEYIIAVHPIILGKGIPLFLKSDKEVKLIFKRCVNYESGLLQLFYERAE